MPPFHGAPETADSAYKNLFLRQMIEHAARRLLAHRAHLANRGAERLFFMLEAERIRGEISQETLNFLDELTAELEIKFRCREKFALKLTHRDIEFWKELTSAWGRLPKGAQTQAGRLETFDNIESKYTQRDLIQFSMLRRLAEEDACCVWRLPDGGQPGRAGWMTLVRFSDASQLEAKAANFKIPSLCHINPRKGQVRPEYGVSRPPAVLSCDEKLADQNRVRLSLILFDGNKFISHDLIFESKRFFEVMFPQSVGGPQKELEYVTGVRCGKSVLTGAGLFGSDWSKKIEINAACSFGLSMYEKLVTKSAAPGEPSAESLKNKPIGIYLNSRFETAPNPQSAKHNGSQAAFKAHSSGARQTHVGGSDFVNRQLRRLRESSGDYVAIG